MIDLAMFPYTENTTCHSEDCSLTLFRMGFFGAAHGWGTFLAPLLKTGHTYPTMMKLGTDIPYLRKIQKMDKSRDTSLEFW